MAKAKRKQQAQRPVDNSKEYYTPDEQDGSKYHILNWGMGVDSTAILLRWILEPSTRPFKDLSQLIVLTAQTGDEFPSSKYLIDTFIAPLLKKHKIRWVQICRAGPTTTDEDGITVLQDTHNLKPGEKIEAILQGDDDEHFKLSDENLRDGVTPTIIGPHQCAQKFKGWVIDRWLRLNMEGKAFGPYLGYSYEEHKRMVKCEEYTFKRKNDAGELIKFFYKFPLNTWKWTRDKSAAYIDKAIQQLTGQKLPFPWRKSCCTFCPYIDEAEAVRRFKAEPEAAAEALLNEAMALAANDRMHLFKHGFAYKMCEKNGITRTLERFREILAQQQEWAVYRIDRFYETKVTGEKQTIKDVPARRVTRPFKGSQAECLAELDRIAASKGLPVEQSHHFKRVTSEYLDPELKKVDRCEGFWVVAPNLMSPKVSRKRFNQIWHWMSREPEKRTLYHVRTIKAFDSTGKPTSGNRTLIEKVMDDDGNALECSSQELMAHLKALSAEHGVAIKEQHRLQRPNLPTVPYEPVKKKNKIEGGYLEAEGFYTIGPPTVEEVNAQEEQRGSFVKAYDDVYGRGQLALDITRAINHVVVTKEERTEPLPEFTAHERTGQFDLLTAKFASDKVAANG